MGCFSGRLMSAASDQKLFYELCSAFNCSFDEFVGEKVCLPVLFLHHLGSSSGNDLETGDIFLHGT